MQYRALVVLLLAAGLAACSQGAIAPQPQSVVQTQAVEVVVTQVQGVMQATGGAPVMELPASGDALRSQGYPTFAQPQSGVAPEAGPAIAATAEPGTGKGGAGGGGLPANVPPSTRMVIKDADLDLLVQDVDLAISKVTQLAADRGGYLISSQIGYADEIKMATLRFAVPSASFEATLNNLRALAFKVVRETASGQDVSAEYVDLQTRLANLEATAARVREFLADAKTVEESLRVNQQLSELEGQIAQIKGQMQFYEGRAAFSTITVALRPELPTPTPTSTPTPTQTPTPTPTVTPTPGWNPGDTANQATGVLVNLTRGVTDVLIWVGIVGGPFILLGLMGWGIGRRVRR